jgi:alkylated DNA repair dioxygenase AlkB
MPNDLLDGLESENLPMADADVKFWRLVDLGEDSEQLLQQLIDDSAWRQEKITVYGKPYLQPRLSAWHGDLSYGYSGIRLEPLPWTATLLEIRRRVENLVKHEFNSVLLNYYRDQKDKMGMHSDDEAELGAQPVIASLSLGETRTLLFRHRSRRDLKTLKLALPSARLLLMRGDTQKHWRHGINAEKHACGPRINLTFRAVTALRGSPRESDS